MIVGTVLFHIAPGKNAEAMDYLRKISKQITTVTKVEYRLMVRLGGAAGQVALSGETKTMADWDAARKKSAADATTQKMIAKAGADGLFIPGSVQMGIWEIV